MKLKVKEHPGLYRDSFSKGIVSEDNSGYHRYIKERQMRDKTNHVETEINNMKSEIKEIKEMLRELLNR